MGGNGRKTVVYELNLRISLFSTIVITYGPMFGT
jgi:hypothetical protein